MDYNSIINQVIVLFLIMIAGYIARKSRVISKEINEGLSELLLNVTLPMLIISSFNYDFSKEILKNALALLICSIIIHSFLVPVSRLLYFKYKDDVKNVMRYATVFSNCAFMGYPVVESVYGKIGVFYTSIFNIPFNILLWTVGIILYTRKRDLKTIKKAIINPGLISVLIGLIIFIFSIKLPGPIYKTFEMVGSITTPLSMIVIGSMLAEMSVKDVFSGSVVYYSSFIRLVAIPLLVFGILKYIGATGMMLGIPTLVTAMPAAANTAIFAQKYGADAAFASRCVLVSTLLSSLTIPLIILLL